MLILPDNRRMLHFIKNVVSELQLLFILMLLNIQKNYFIRVDEVNSAAKPAIPVIQQALSSTEPWAPLYVLLSYSPAIGNCFLIAGHYYHQFIHFIQRSMSKNIVLQQVFVKLLT